MSKWRALGTALARARADWRWGRRCGYPRCCIAMYCWDRLWSLPPSLTRAVAQGVDGPDPACEWVPCGVFHHGGSPLSLAERVHRLTGYWWWALPFVIRDGSPQGWLRAPWVAKPEPNHCGCPASAPGPVEEAWTELDGQMQDPELDWI